MVVEGGNLGLTQAARIEYALAGGKVNTDFIDNSGGVNCSDREVNLKILLRLAAERKGLTREERDKLVAAAAPEVVDPHPLRQLPAGPDDLPGRGCLHPQGLGA